MRPLFLLSVLALVSANFLQAQVPVHEDPKAPVPQALGEPIRGLAAWDRTQRLVGGEWHADEHFYKKSFRIFREGPQGTSLFIENRDRDDLGAPLSGISVLFYDPSKDQVRSVGVGSNGSYYAGEIYWQGEMMVNEQRYYIKDGAEVDGVPIERSLDLVERFTFEANQAFRWELFQKSSEGLASLLETLFTHRAETTELPTPRADEAKPNRAFRFLEPLLGTHGDSDAGWQLSAGWQAGCQVLWVERTLPNPFGEKPMNVTGFYYWEPFAKTFRFLGFSSRGDLIQGTTQQNDARQIETTFEISPVAVRNEDQVAERPFGRLGETVSVLENGSLSIAWVLLGPTGQPKVIEASLKNR